MVNAVVQEWLCQVLSNETTRSGYGDTIWNFPALFYVDYSYSASRNKQEALDFLVGFFERTRLVTNVGKAKAMTCIPGKIITRPSDNVYAGQLEGLSKKQ